MDNDLTTYPIPFFGNIETARVLTVGVNPSREEFDLDRGWPNEMKFEDWKNRLINYFSDQRHHMWFDKWEEALGVLGVSYFDNTAAHLDLSLRPTFSMSSLKGERANLFGQMLESDIKWLFELFPFCKEAKLIILAGTPVKNLYMNQFIKKNAKRFGFELTGDFKGTRKPGKAKTDFHSLISEEFSFKRPVFFCSSSPSDRDPETPPEETGKETWISLRIEEHKDKLISHLR